MKRVVLSRLWYLFPPDDQDLGPDAFARKVTSFVNTLSPQEQHALLDFLIVQYRAFERQLELLHLHAALSDTEYQQRAGRLAHCLAHLEAWQRPGRAAQAASGRRAAGLEELGASPAPCLTPRPADCAGRVPLVGHPGNLPAI